MAKEQSPQGEDKPGLLGQALSGMAAKAKEGWDNLYVGEGHLAAMGRLGLAELRNAFNPSRESVATTDMGLYGAATPGEIAEARRDDDSLQGLDNAAQQKAKEREQEGPGKSQGLER